LYLFPAVALAIYVTQASRVRDDVFIAGARATADQVTPEDREKGILFPPPNDIQKAAIKTAIATAQKIFEPNLCIGSRKATARRWDKDIWSMS
jgi:malate dehydrogenase (oxaloacetate-decarboxylating)(NADP+)